MALPASSTSAADVARQLLEVGRRQASSFASAVRLVHRLSPARGLAAIAPTSRVSDILALVACDIARSLMPTSQTSSDGMTTAIVAYRRQRPASLAPPRCAVLAGCSGDTNPVRDVVRRGRRPAPSRRQRRISSARRRPATCDYVPVGIAAPQRADPAPAADRGQGGRGRDGCRADRNEAAAAAAPTGRRGDAAAPAARDRPASRRSDCSGAEAEVDSAGCDLSAVLSRAEMPTAAGARPARTREDSP